MESRTAGVCADSRPAQIAVSSELVVRIAFIAGRNIEFRT
jgi:hypothetical protein